MPTKMPTKWGGNENLSREANKGGDLSSVIEPTLQFSTKSCVVIVVGREDFLDKKLKHRESWKRWKKLKIHFQKFIELTKNIVFHWNLSFAICHQRRFRIQKIKNVKKGKKKKLKFVSWPFLPHNRNDQNVLLFHSIAFVCWRICPQWKEPGLSFQLSKLSKIVSIVWVVKNYQNCPKLLKVVKIAQLLKRKSKNLKIVKKS